MSVSRLEQRQSLESDQFLAEAAQAISLADTVPMKNAEVPAVPLSAKPVLKGCTATDVNNMVSNPIILGNQPSREFAVGALRLGVGALGPPPPNALNMKGGSCTACISTTATLCLAAISAER